MEIIGCGQPECRPIPGAEAINSAVMEKPSQPSLSAEDKQLILNQVILAGDLRSGAQRVLLILILR
jgi:hypothetical protein